MSLIASPTYTPSSISLKTAGVKQQDIISLPIAQSFLASVLSLGFLGMFFQVFPGFIVASSVKFSDFSAILPQTRLLLSKASKQLALDL